MHHGDGTKDTFFDHPVRHTHKTMPSFVEAHQDFSVRSRSPLYELIGFLQGQGKGLFQKQMLARIQGGHRYFKVGFQGDQDSHSIH
jgi:hypothetical protein